MQFHEKLQMLRKEKGLSQEKLAEMLGVSRQAISHMSMPMKSGRQ
jgi:transcriptional regulator with XRE-family HTH domain